MASLVLEINIWRGGGPCPNHGGRLLKILQRAQGAGGLSWRGFNLTSDFSSHRSGFSISAKLNLNQRYQVHSSDQELDAVTDGKNPNIVTLLLLNCFIFVMSAKYNIEDTKQNKLSSIDLIIIYLKSFTHLNIRNYWLECRLLIFVVISVDPGAQRGGVGGPKSEIYFPATWWDTCAHWAIQGAVLKTSRTSERQF